MIAMPRLRAESPAATSPATQPVGDYRQFTLTATPPPTPALKYRFDVDPLDRLKGNAAPLYLQALVLYADRAQLEALVAIEDVEPDAEYAKQAAVNVPWLDTEVPSMLVDAQRLRDCEWEIPVRERGMDALLPYLNEMRAVANLLRDKTRLATAKGDPAAALELIRAAIVMANRADDGSATFAVNSLVSVGIYAMMLERIDRVMEMPNSPNLYWALRAIPQEFANQKTVVESIREESFYMFPAMVRARNEDLSGEEWRALLASMRTRIAEYMERTKNWQPATRPGEVDDRPTRVSDRAAVERNEKAGITAARMHYMQTRGIDASAAEKIDPSVLIGVWYFDAFAALQDATTTAVSLPYPQRLKTLKRVVTDLASVRREQPSNPFLILNDPLERFVVTDARTDRMTAAHCVVEAIRSYAAAHNGALPPTLDAIGDVTPAPENPTTGRPFDYRVEGDRAILSDDGTTLGNGEKIASYPLDYVVRIRH